jgi:hypothetical protein
VPPPPEITVNRVAIDTDISDKPADDPRAVGSVEVCRSIAVGDTLDIDVVVEGIEAVTENGSGMLAFQFTLGYDENWVRVVAVDVEMLLAAAPGSSVFSVVDPLPDRDGSLTVSGLDVGPLSAAETGDGVLARITVEGVAPGLSDLGIEGAVGLTDTEARSFAVPDVSSAQVAVVVACP